MSEGLGKLQGTTGVQSHTSDTYHRSAAKKLTKDDSKVKFYSLPRKTRGASSGSR